LKTAPATVIDDQARLIRLACYHRFLPRDKQTPLKANISWHQLSSIQPVRLRRGRWDGVIAPLLEDPKDPFQGCHNRTVVVDDRRGEVGNKHKSAVVNQ